MKLSGKKGTEQSKKKSVGKAKKASEVIKVPGDWLYMTPQEILSLIHISEPTRPY